MYAHAYTSMSVKVFLVVCQGRSRCTALSMSTTLGPTFGKFRSWKSEVHAVFRKDVFTRTSGDSVRKAPARRE